ncbi:MAG: hypothetical protein EOP04_11495 [Proteobacteria bacterium]|nr:MAG: hypothetical protein EOP04_11495 [Pseudomonadota bacterium]
MTTASLYDNRTYSAEDVKPTEKVRSIAKTRVQLDMTPRALERLNFLKEKTEAASYAEVIKNALKLYDGLIAEVDQGSEFLTKNKEGQIAPFKMFL